MRARVLAASARRPFLSNQRGLSGTKYMPAKNSSEGAAVRANIQRQPCWPNQEPRINSSLAPAGRSRTSHQLSSCATSTPTTMVNWFTDTSRPRIEAGATSEMYIGDRLDARPMATPPRMRQIMKTVNVSARPLPIEVMAKRAAEAISRRLRPKRSLNTPQASAPARQPISAQLLAQPESAALVSMWKNRSKNGLAPPTTTQSQPKSSPPRAATMEMSQM